MFIGKKNMQVKGLRVTQELVTKLNNIINF